MSKTNYIFLWDSSCAFFQSGRIFPSIAKKDLTGLVRPESSDGFYQGHVTFEEQEPCQKI
jgi:hypothetical protein